MSKQKALIFVSISLVIIILVAIVLSIIGKIEISNQMKGLFREEDGWKKVENFSGGPQAEPWDGAGSELGKLPNEIKGEIVSLAEKILIVEQPTGALEIPYNINETPVFKEKGNLKEKISSAELKLGASVTVHVNEAGDSASEIIIQ